MHRGAHDPASPPAVFGQVRRVHNDLQKKFEADLKGRSDRQSLAKAGRWASWAEIIAAAQHVLDTFASLQKAYARSRRGQDVEWTPAVGAIELRRRLAESAQESLLCSLYVRLPPGRAKEFSNLVWAKSSAEQPSPSRENLLVVDATTGAASLKLGGFKTVKRMGVQCLDLARADFDAYVAAVLEHRAVLLRGKAHPFVFCRTTDGSAMTGSGVWSGWVASVFARALEATHVRPVGEGDGWVAPRVSVNALRKSFVTQVHGAVDTTLQQRESVAAAMRCVAVHLLPSTAPVHSR